MLCIFHLIPETARYYVLAYFVFMFVLSNPEADSIRPRPELAYPKIRGSNLTTRKPAVSLYYRDVLVQRSLQIMVWVLQVKSSL